MNKYKFDLNMSAKISAKTVTEMVKQLTEEQTGRKVSNVEINYGICELGYAREESETVFDGVTVHFQKD
jgi:hypothetical protein